jgi:hypothetical protein
MRCCRPALAQYFRYGDVRLRYELSGPTYCVNTRTVACAQVIDPTVCVLRLRSVTCSRNYVLIAAPQKLQTCNPVRSATVGGARYKYDPTGQALNAIGQYVPAFPIIRLAMLQI